jgi:hypothetical protein
VNQLGVGSCRPPRAEASAIPLGIGLGAATGALPGALIGAPFRSEKWERVPIDQVRITPDLEGGGITLQVTARP